MLHLDGLDGVEQQPAARIFCKVTAPCFFVVKLVFADDPHPLCLVQFFYLRTVFGDNGAGMGFYDGQSLSQMGVSYRRLSRKWENKKRSLGLGTPEFFSFKNQMPETFGPPDVKNLSKSKLPKKTLKQYITQHWENIIKRKIGVFTADDIVVLNSKGQELRLTKGFIS